MRSALSFVIGFVLGAVALYAYLLSSGRVSAVVPTVTAAAASKPEPGGRMVMPIEGVTPADLHDSFEEGRANHKHEAIDIMRPRGTPVRAVVEGQIVKLFLSKQGGITIYEFDDAAKYCYYYAHLDRYAEGLSEKQRVRRGQVIGYVGSTGDADANAPHLHFSIFELGPEKQWWKGLAINPYPILRDLASR